MIIIRRVRQPHEILLAAMCIPIGVGGLVSPNRPSTLADFPTAFVILWYVGSLVGGAITLIGVCKKAPLDGPRIERAGLRVLAGLWLAYALAVLVTSGQRGMSFVLLTVGFSIGNLLRVRQINQEIKDIKAAIKEADDRKSGGGDA